MTATLPPNPLDVVPLQVKKGIEIIGHDGNQEIIPNLSYLNSSFTCDGTISHASNYSDNFFKLDQTPSFKFPGFGLSFSKSLRSFESFGMNVKLPVSANCPRYDKVQYFPRLTSSVGISYPLEYKCTISVSLPAISAFYCSMILCHYLKLMKRSMWQELQEKKDPLRRVGFAVSFRLSPLKGFRVSCGPWMSQFSSSGGIIIRTLLPFIAAMPAALLMIYSIFGDFGLWLLKWIYSIVDDDYYCSNYNEYFSTHRSNSSSEVCTDDTDEWANEFKLQTQSKLFSSDTPGIPDINAASEEILESVLDSKMNSIVECRNPLTNFIFPNFRDRFVQSIYILPKMVNKQRIRTLERHKKIMKWLQTKGPVTVFSTGVYISASEVPYLGSSAIFELQKFYPFHSQVSNIAHKATNTMRSIRQFFCLSNSSLKEMGSWCRGLFNYNSGIVSDDLPAEPIEFIEPDGNSTAPCLPLQSITNTNSESLFDNSERSILLRTGNRTKNGI